MRLVLASGPMGLALALKFKTLADFGVDYIAAGYYPLVREGQE